MKQRDLRIVFMGTPEFAVATLKKLLEQHYNVVGVITAPDRPAGRGQQLRESDVKIFAKQHGLPILQPTNLKNERFLEALKALEPNLQIVVAFRMLPAIVWQIPEYGTFNLHASLLPQYRGAAPINWAIINGETKTGVTTFFIDDKIDTGEVILQKEVKIGNNENAGSLHDKLKAIGAELVLNTVDIIASKKISTSPQLKTETFKTANKLNSDNCRINWNESISNIFNKIRGLSPYPGAWTVLRNGDSQLNVKIFSALTELMDHDLPIGMLQVSKSELRVAVSKGFINIEEIQFAGKRKMHIKDALNGFNFESNAKML